MLVPGQVSIKDRDDNPTNNNNNPPSIHPRDQPLTVKASKMSDDINIFISNGTCYSDAHLEADGAMIPCGNDANDHIACCQAGDNCLESSVCYNPEYGVTYVSGCSDPSYEHPSCPNKFNDNGE